MANDGEKHLQAAYEQLIEDSIKVQFEKNGTIGKLQSELHVKVLQMLKGQFGLNSNDTLSGGYGDGSKCAANEGLMGLLNQLIIEYFDWFGFKHTMETFKMESGVKVTKRKELLGQFGCKFSLKELPVLMQMIMQEQEKDKTKNIKVKQLTSMKQPSAKEEKSVIEHLAKNSSIKQMKVTQKTIENPLAKTSVVKQMKSLPVSATKIKKPSSKPLNRENCKSSSDNESDVTDYNSSSSEDDPFSDIPNRYYYREMDPPERRYPIGFGEEGPYKTKEKAAEILFQKYKKQVTPTNSKNLFNNKSKTKQLGKSEKTLEQANVMTGREALEIQLNRALKAKAKTVTQNTPRTTGKNLWTKQRSPPSEIEPELAVMKPKCPDTLISDIQLESDDEESDALDCY